MLVKLFPRMHRRYSSLPVLGPILGDYASWLVARGYPPIPVRRHVRAARRLERRWRRRGVRTLSAIRRSDFACVHRATPRMMPIWPPWRDCFHATSKRSTCCLVRLIHRRHQELAGYRAYLEVLRGLAPSTVTHHLATAAELLRWLAGETRRGDLAGLTPTDVDAFLQQISPRFGRASLQHTVAHLRGFLRFLAVRDRAPKGLDRHIDTPRVYRQEQLPRALPWESVRALLESIDRTTPLGRRDYAMLLLIATYGLRTSEVVALTLDDIAWRRDELHVPRRKVDGVLLLPLTTEVGAALLDYIRRDRPALPTRVVFLRARPPAGVLKATAVTEVFQARARRSGLGIPFQGPHCLRHSLAVRLLQEGVSLKAIGDVPRAPWRGEHVCVSASRDRRSSGRRADRTRTRRGIDPGGAAMTPHPLSVPAFTSLLGPSIAAYLQLKEALGRQYAAERAILRALDTFLTRARADLTVDTFAAWNATLVRLTSGVHRNWLRVVRNLCLYRQRTRPNVFVPDATGFPDPISPARPTSSRQPRSPDYWRRLIVSDRRHGHPYGVRHSAWRSFCSTRAVFGEASWSG